MSSKMYMDNWRANRSPEQRARDAESSRKYRAKTKIKRTPAQLERQRELKRVSNLTPEQIEKKRKRARDHSRKCNYGLTADQWEKMFDAQGRCCWICRSEHSGGKRDWSTDHCHSTEVVRGILCRQCNIGLGGFKDNIQSLFRAVIYLQRSIYAPE